MRQGEASIILHDLGPVSPSAMQREAARIIELWRGGNAQGAQTRVQRLLDNVVRFVQEPSRTPLVNTMLPLLESEAHRLPELELGQRFADWRQALGTLPGVSLEASGTPPCRSPATTDGAPSSHANGAPSAASPPWTT